MPEFRSTLFAAALFSCSIPMHLGAQSDLPVVQVWLPFNAEPAPFGGSQSQDLNIRNHGPGDVAIVSLVFTGTAAAEYSIPTPPLDVIPEGETVTVPIRCTPSIVGRRVADLTVTFAEAVEPVHTVTLITTAFETLTASLEGVAYLATATTLIEVDLETGNRRLIYTPGQTDPPLHPISGLSGRSGKLLLSRNDKFQITELDPATGQFRIVSRTEAPVIGAGSTDYRTSADAFWADETTAYSHATFGNSRFLLGVNLATGDRTVIAGGDPFGTTIGTGQYISGNISNLVPGDAPGTLRYADDAGPLLMTVDLATGNRERIFFSGADKTVRSLVFLPDGSALFAHGSTWITRNNPTTRTSTTLSGVYLGGVQLGGGIPLKAASGMALTQDGRVLVFDPNRSVLLDVDIATGDRAVISGWGPLALRGTGPGADDPASYPEAFIHLPAPPPAPTVGWVVD